MTDGIDTTVGPRINAPDSGGEVVTGRGSWPWLASLGRYRNYVSDIFWFKYSITVLTLFVSSSSFTDTKMASGGTSVEDP